MSYNSSTKIISAPVSIRDVQQALGLSYNDLGTLIQNGAINIWAKYKPVHSNLLQTTDQWDFTNSVWKSSATWFHGNPTGSLQATVSYGLTAWSAGLIQDIIDKYDEGSTMNGWVYNRPTGGSSSVFRLEDFAMYKHDVNSFASSFQCNDPTLDSEHVAKLFATFFYTPESTYSVTPENILGGAKYFGIAVVNGSGTIMGYATSSSAGSVTAIVELDNLTAGYNYKVYPFWADSAVSSSGSAGNNTFYTVPLLSPATITVYSQGSDHGGLLVSASYMTIELSGGTIEDDRTTVIVSITNTRGYLYKGYIQLLNGETVVATWGTASNPRNIAGNDAETRAVIMGIDASTYGSLTGKIYYRTESASTYDNFTFYIKRTGV